MIGGIIMIYCSSKEYFLLDIVNWNDKIIKWMGQCFHNAYFVWWIFFFYISDLSKVDEIKLHLTFLKTPNKNSCTVHGFNIYVSNCCSSCFSLFLHLHFLLKAQEVSLPVHSISLLDPFVYLSCNLHLSLPSSFFLIPSLLSILGVVACQLSLLLS